LLQEPAVGVEAATVFRVRFTEWTDLATDTPLAYSLAYRTADDAGASERSERTLVPAQASSRVTAVLPRGAWTLVGRVHDAHGTFVTVEAATAVTVRGAADGRSRRRRRRLMQAVQRGRGSVTGGRDGDLEVEVEASEVSGESGVGRVEGRRLTQWDAGVDDGWTPAEVAAAQAAAQRVEEALQTGAAVMAAQLAAAYAERFGGGGGDGDGGEVVRECGGVRVSAAAVHTRVLRVVHAVRMSLAPASDSVVRSLSPTFRLLL
jgi:hypothetical protein